MRYQRVFIESFDYELAPVVVTTDELEDRLAPTYDALKIQPGQLEAMTGIYERRYWQPGTSVVDGAAAAATKVLARSSVPPSAIEALIYGGVCREHFEPATACHVAARLEDAGLAISSTATVYDVSNACLGVLNGMLDIANRIELGQIRAGMVVSCESAREIVDIAIQQMLAHPDLETFKLSVATLTGGSGAVAVVLSDGSFATEGRRQLLGGVVEAAPRHHMLCRWGVQPLDASGATSVAGDPDRREFMSTDPVAVLEHGVVLGQRTWRAFLGELDWSVNGDGSRTVDRVVSHQVGAAHRTSILEVLGIPAAKDFVAYDHLGNTGTVALPLAMALADQRGFLEPGHRVGLLGIGSGLNCMMLGVRW